jgi:predicted MFS family arabinose efflux permease
MVASQVPLIFLNAGLALGLLFGRVEIWHLFPFVILSGFAMALNQPARQTAVFDLVPRENVPNAVALNQSAMSVTRALGPSAAAFMLGVFGASGNFFIQAIAYIGVTATTLMIVFPPKQPAKERRSFMKDSADGFRYVAKEPLARWLMFMSIIMPLFIIPTLNTLMPVFAKDVYGLGPSGFGFLVMAIGIGNFGGALFTASLGSFERRGLIQLSSLFVTGISLFGFAFAPNIYIGVPLLLICGFAEMIFLPTNTTLMQLSVPDHMRGRITSILLLNPLLIPIGSFLVGVGVDGFGGPATVAISAGASTVLGLLVWVASPRLRNLRLSELRSAQEAAT